MVKRKLTVGGLIGHLASVSHFHCVFFVCFFPHAISFWNMIPGSLLPLFSCGRTDAPKDARRHTFTFLTKRYNVVLSFRTTRVRVPLARNPSPLQYPTLHVQCFSVRSLLRQPRSALEAGPSEARAISFVLTPRPHLHRKGYTFSMFFRPYQRNNGQSLIGLKRHPFSGPVDSVGELLHTP